MALTFVVYKKNLDIYLDWTYPCHRVRGVLHGTHMEKWKFCMQQDVDNLFRKLYKKKYIPTILRISHFVEEIQELPHICYSIPCNSFTFIRSMHDIKRYEDLAIQVVWLKDSHYQNSCTHTRTNCEHCTMITRAQCTSTRSYIHSAIVPKWLNIHLNFTCWMVIHKTGRSL